VSDGLALTCAFLAFCGHWLEFGPAWQGLIAAGIALSLLSQYRSPLYLPALALVVCEGVSAGWNQRPLADLLAGPLPFVYFALAGHRRFLSSPAWWRRLQLAATVIGLHALISLLAFRAAGGGHRIRPPIESGWLQALVWPYYAGHYKYGAHAVGLFLNDNMLGLWCVALVPTLLVGRHRLSAAVLMLTTVWTYSRGATLAWMGSWLYLAVGLPPAERRRLALGALLLVAMAAPMATWLDHQRFLNPTRRGIWPAERIINLRRGLHTLATGSLLGSGPGSQGLVDSQLAKTALELGWLGVLAYAGFFWRALSQPAHRPHRAGVIALLLGCLGADLLYSPHLAATLFWLAGQAKTPSEYDELPRPPNPECPASESPATEPEPGPQ